MINSDYGIEEKRLRQIKEYAYLHKMSIANVIRIAIDKFLKEERIKEVRRLKGVI